MASAITFKILEDIAKDLSGSEVTFPTFLDITFQVRTGPPPAPRARSPSPPLAPASRELAFDVLDHCAGHIDTRSGLDALESRRGVDLQ